MNIICSSCVGSRIYQQLSVPYNNPFMWNSISGSEFNKLLMHFNDIDLNNFKISLEDKMPYTTVMFDDFLTIYYIHYKWRHNIESYKRAGIDIIGDFDSIYNYTETKIKERLLRMGNEQPLFIFDAFPKGYPDSIWQTYSQNEILDFYNARTLFHKLIVVIDSECPDELKSEPNVVIFPSYVDTITRAKTLISKFPDLFRNSENS